MKQYLISFLFLILIIFPLFGEEKNVSLVTCEWEPFYGSKLEKNGFFTEIVREAFQNVDYNLEASFIGWTDALDAARANKYNGLLGAYYTQEREKDFIYSLPVYTAKILFIARKEVAAIYDGSLDNLKGLRIGIVKGYSYTEEFDTITSLTKVYATDPEDLLKTIISNKTDVIAIETHVAQHLLKQKFNSAISDLIALGPSLTENKLYVTISRKVPNGYIIVEDFNKGLKQLISEGRLEVIYHNAIAAGQ